MAFNFKPLQRNHLFSITLCKYPPALNASKILFSLSHFLPAHTIHPEFTLRANISHVSSELSSIEEIGNGFFDLGSKNGLTRKNDSSKRFMHNKQTRKTLDLRKNEMGFDGSERKSKRINSSAVVERTENRFSQKETWKRIDSPRGGKGSNVSSMNEDLMRKSRRGVNSAAIRQNIEKKVNKGDKKKVVEKMEGKGTKKNKADDPGVQLRIGLDMCSRKGNVMDAIALYDSARRDGIKMGQYHYTVLLYLCASAAVGVVKPAKSGSGNRSLNTLGLANEITDDGPNDLSEDENEGNADVGGIVLKNQISDNRGNFDTNEEVTLSHYCDDIERPGQDDEDAGHLSDGKGNEEDKRIVVTEDAKQYALHRGFEIYEKMQSENVPMNEATLTAVGRMAMSMGNGDMAFDMVKQMKKLNINPRLRSYGPALSTFCNNGEIEKAFLVEQHMLEHGVHPEEPELAALLKVSVELGKSDKVYYLMHKLRTSVRRVLPSTANFIEKWFSGKTASRVGKRKWDQRLIKEAIENGGGGWHGQGWLGKGKWTVSRTRVGLDGSCNCCREKLATIDLDPVETEKFAESVASIASQREKHSSFQKFQINAVVNGIRQKLPSKKWPLIVLHNKRITGQKMDEPVNKALIERWKNADALYATPTGSNDDWYWLYAAIKFKCLVVTNDEMRDHNFQLLGNDFFPKWKERHHVHFSFDECSPVFHMPPPYSVVIQESEQGHWHVPIESEHISEEERTWLCITRRTSSKTMQVVAPKHEGKRKRSTGFTAETESIKNQARSNHQTGEILPNSARENYRGLKGILSATMFSKEETTLSRIEAAEELGKCTIDFQI
ncbi:Protein-only RNase P, C-terminal [Dillenia turbinata]|uniref:ribonuclease P n=1 Tax=Dillenia turbinata TaxID=194707 RepID=A0AAN8ZTR5_9MAGN